MEQLGLEQAPIWGAGSGHGNRTWDVDIKPSLLFALKVFPGINSWGGGSGSFFLFFREMRNSACINIARLKLLFLGSPEWLWASGSTPRWTLPSAGGPKEVSACRAETGRLRAALSSQEHQLFQPFDSCATGSSHTHTHTHTSKRTLKISPLDAVCSA